HLDCPTQKDFLSQLQNNLNIPLEKADLYYNEITELLVSSNQKEEVDIKKPKYPLIPKSDIVELYCFGNTVIKINFGSEDIKALIYPQWTHATAPRTDAISCSFHIFKDGNNLYLYKDNLYIGHYPLTDYHLLQGQFALQLINVLYDKQESEWIATFHASTVCNDKEAIMIIGDSGNGKSTLSAVLMASGFDVLADDFTPLSAENANVYRFPSGISVKKGAFSILQPLFPDFDQFAVYRSTSKPVDLKYIPPIKRFGEAISHVPCHKIVYVKYDAYGKSELKAVGTDKILPTLIPESWLSPVASNAQLFLNWLKDVQCFELRYSDNDYAVAQFRKLLHS
ncbi:MAG: hypothetical protein WA749_08655, partial [Gelidibacter sp.]